MFYATLMQKYNSFDKNALYFLLNKIFLQSTVYLQTHKTILILNIYTHLFSI
jgi:hypothetical protein